MKLATLDNDTRDGALAVVTRDLEHAAIAYDIAPTLQAALDDWDYAAPRLAALYESLNRDATRRGFPLDPAKLRAPLPRAYQWCDASAYLNHVELVRKARQAEMPKELAQDPLMYQGGSDAFLGARADVPIESEDWGIDLEGEVAVITGDVPMGVKPDRAGQYIRLVMLANDVSLRELIPAELAKGFGFLNGKTWTAFSPVAVTPDELGSDWDGRKLHRPLVVHVNDALLGQPNAGEDMAFHFPRLIAHAAKTRPLGAGTIVGSGTVSNKTRSAGCACIAERRAVEMIQGKSAKTPYLKFGDRVRIEMFDAAGQSIFGAIDQRIVAYAP
jgi:fumarylacetoacetate (FAA) hydrolase